MSIKTIEEAPGKSQRSYTTGHVFKCFVCDLWVRALRDNEICESCNRANGIKKTIPMYGQAKAE